MANLVITMDGKHPDKFLILTEKDVSIFGWKTKEKFRSYYMRMSPWNLLDLAIMAPKLGIEFEYDPLVMPIVQILRGELQRYRDARLIKSMPEDDIDMLWEEAGFPELLPNITADPHQKRMSLWLLKVMRGGCYMEQGTGKTPAGIFVLTKLLAEGVVKRPLVLAPVSLLSETAWFKDLRRFSNFVPFNLREKPEDIRDGEIHFVNFDKLYHWGFKKTGKAKASYDLDNFFERAKFDAIYYDESSSLRGHASYRTEAMIRLERHAKFIALASGTPAPNSPFQFWGQMRVLDSVLGDHHGAFEQRYGVQRVMGPVTKWVARSGAEQEIRARIDDASYFIDRGVLNLPARHTVDVPVKLHADHLAFYRQVENDMIAAVQGFDAEGNLLEGNAKVTHQIAMRMKLLQIMNGFVTVTNDDGDEQKMILRWNAKLDEADKLIQRILSESPENNIIIWCAFRQEVETLYNKYKDKASYIYGGMSDKKREAALVRWLDDSSCRIMVAIPGAAKYGHTWLKANNSIYYSTTEDFDNFAQSRDRNYRRGQDREVFEHKLITVNTIERKIWNAIAGRKDLHNFFYEYYKNAKPHSL